MYAFIRFFMAMLLAVLLGVAVYAGLWLVALNQASSTMKSAVGNVLGATLTHGAPIWVPDVTQVAMRLPYPSLTFTSGPLQKIEAPSMVLEIGFFTHDRWRLLLPPQVQVTMANGNRVTLESKGGEILWLAASNSLTLRAQAAALATPGGTFQVDDVLLERAPSGDGVRLNVASRPVWGGVPAQFSGHVVLPQPALAAVLGQLGSPQGTLPGIGDILKTVAQSLRTSGGRLTLENISFRRQGQGAGFGGWVEVGPDDRLTGQLMVTADKPETLQTWLVQAGVGPGQEAPVNTIRKPNFARVWASLSSGIPAAKMETPRGDWMLNGTIIGRAPLAQTVLQRLWP